ncbi:acyl carrier protein [Paraburkholderia sp. SOS3]|jgi:acyl carrier protein|uniref:acyl carrier protein n=1 Tax=Paraburkholderia sp. SOS3 TaxID=1926494 RepID=UPI0009477818|nr:acyl carrier protein [Paraburkholderia sp. SOS3]APR38762.1 phosphopantetheine-binding protein [Paraburkholderia sp. SOS3]
MSDQLQATPMESTAVNADQILAWIQEWTEANNLKVPADLDQTFAEAGFDSMHSVELAFFLEERLRIKIDETVLFDYPTFASLAGHLVSLSSPATASEPQIAAPSNGSAGGAGNW